MIFFSFASSMMKAINRHHSLNSQLTLLSRHIILPLILQYDSNNRVWLRCIHAAYLSHMQSCYQIVLDIPSHNDTCIRSHCRWTAGRYADRDCFYMENPLQTPFTKACQPKKTSQAGMWALIILYGKI